MPIAPPKQTLVTIPQRTIVQRPVAPVRAPLPAQVPNQVQPMQMNAVPYSIRTFNTSSYRPSLPVQANTSIVTPYKQTTYRVNTLNTKNLNRPVQMRRMPAPIRTVAPIMPNVSSYRPPTQVTLPPATVTRPQGIIQPQIPTVRQIQAAPAQTAIVSPITPRVQVPIQQSAVRPVQVPVTTAPVFSQASVRPVQVPVTPAPVFSQASVRQVPAQPVPAVASYKPVPAQPVPAVTSYRPVPVQPAQAIGTVRPVPVQVPVRPAPIVSQVPVARPPVAAVTPLNVAPNVVRAPVQNVRPLVAPVAQPVAQNMLIRPSTYTASTYRPSNRRNIGGFGYRPAIPMVNNTMINNTGYTTRTYRPRRL